MSLTLHFHPFSSYCQKVLVALYEAGAAFTPQNVNLGDPGEAAAFRAVWPMGRFPVLVDAARGATIAESSVIIEYLDRHHPGPAPMLPADPDLRLHVRMLDRCFDNYVMTPMQKIVADAIRAPEARDRQGVAEARALLRQSYGWLESALPAHGTDGRRAMASPSPIARRRRRSSTPIWSSRSTAIPASPPTSAGYGHAQASRARWTRRVLSAPSSRPAGPRGRTERRNGGGGQASGKA